MPQQRQQQRQQGGNVCGAGILWLGWNGFNGGDPYFANADAGAAVLNTNTCTAVALLVWTLLDKMAYGKPSVLGAVNGMIAGLVAIAPAAGYVDGMGAIIAGIIPWLAMNKLQKTRFMMKVDDTLSVFFTHGVAGFTGGLLTGIFANPDMLMYIGTDKEAPGVSITGLLYGNAQQFVLQAECAAFIIVYNVVATFIILKEISLIVPLRMDEATLKVGDDAVHGETAYAIGTEANSRSRFGQTKKPPGKPGGLLLESVPRGVAPLRCRERLVSCLCFLPMTSAASPISAAAEQQHQNNDNENQFHGASPLSICQRGNCPPRSKFRLAGAA